MKTCIYCRKQKEEKEFTLEHIIPPLPATLFAATFWGIAATTAHAETVKITTLGSHDGEFCARDRAFVFEDPNGLRIP